MSRTKKTAITLTALALASASWGIEYDTSWMGAYTWTDRSDRLEDNPFGLGPNEARPLHFTGTDYITLSNQAHFQPLVLDGTIYLSGGNRLSGKLTAVISGSVRANNTLWIGENNQVLDVANAEFYGADGIAMATGSSTVGWTINLYDGAVWRMPFTIQNSNANVLDPVVNVFGGTFAPPSINCNQPNANLVRKMTVNFHDGATFDGLTNARGCVPLVVAPDAHVTFKTAAEVRTQQTPLELGAGSVTEIVKFNGNGPDRNRIKIENGSISGSGQVVVKEGAGFDLRPVTGEAFTGTIIVEEGALFGFPTVQAVQSSPDMTVIFRGGSPSDTLYGGNDNKLAYYRGRIEIESWAPRAGFAFGDSPAAVVLKEGCNFAYDKISDLAELTGGAAGGTLTVEKGTAIHVALPADAAFCPAFFGSRTTFPSDGKVSLVVEVSVTCDAVYTLGTGAYTQAALDAIELVLTGAAAASAEAALRVENGDLQLVLTAQGAIARVTGIIPAENGGTTFLKYTIDSLGRDATRADLVLEWSADASFASPLGTKALCTFTETGNFTVDFPELTLPSSVFCRIKTVNDREVEMTNPARAVGLALWRPADAAATWATASWDVGAAGGPALFLDGLSALFDGAETASPAAVSVPAAVEVDELSVRADCDYVFANAGNLSLSAFVKKGAGTVTLQQDSGKAFELPKLTIIEGGTIAVKGASATDGLSLPREGTIEITNALVRAESSGALRTVNADGFAGTTVNLRDGADWQLSILNEVSDPAKTKVFVYPGATFGPASWPRSGSTMRASHLTLNLAGGTFAVKNMGDSGTGSSIACKALEGTTSTIRAQGGGVQVLYGTFELPADATVRIEKQNDNGLNVNRVKLEDNVLTGEGTFVVTSGATLDLRPTRTDEFSGSVNVEEGGGFHFPSSLAIMSSTDMTVNFNGGGVGSSGYAGSNNGLRYFAGVVNIAAISLDYSLSDTMPFKFDASPATVNIVSGGLLAYDDLDDLALFTGGASTGTLNLAAGSTLEVPIEKTPEELPQFLGTRTTFPAEGVATLRVRLSDELPQWKAYVLGTGYSSSVLGHVRAICRSNDGSERRAGLRVVSGRLELLPRSGMMVFIR